MVNRVRILRSNTAGAVPPAGSASDYGRVAVNYPDRKLFGYDQTGAAVLIGALFGDHDPTRSYRAGDMSVQGGTIYRCAVNIPPKAFTLSDWTAIGDYRNDLIYRAPTTAVQSRITLPAALSVEIRANASQSANLQQWTRSDGTVVSAIDAQGYPSEALGRTVFRVAQVAHGFTLVGQAVRFDGTNWVLANASTLAGFATAVVRKIIDANTIELVTDGVITGLAGGAFAGGYVPNTLYFASTTVPGQLTSTAPPDPANYNPVMRTTSGNAGVLLIGAPQAVVAGGTAATVLQAIVTQTPNPFGAIGDIAAHNGTEWVKANPAIATLMPLGVITATAGNVFTVALGGTVTGLSGLTPGQVYYCSATGTLTTTPPTSSVQGGIAVLWATSATAGVAMPGLPPPALLRASQNLADLASAATARTNLGLGTIATQASGAVTITGGTITGITDLAVADGGTGASDAAGARTNLGLGTIATQAAGAVAITGGTITGITDLAIADGGTGASDAATARTNLGLGTSATQDAGAVAITGGSITGVVISSLASDLAIVDGGTGASNAAGARTNLGAASSAIEVTGANGLSGGGALTADRVISATGRLLSIHSIGTTGIMVTRAGGTTFTRDIVGGDGIAVTNGDGDVGNPTVAVNSSVARTATTISAGNGLTGGGSLATDRTLTLGTPSSITSTSTNSVTAGSHTHALGESSVRALIAEGTAGALGTYAFLRKSALNSGIAAGALYDSTELRYAGVVTTTDNWNDTVEGPNNTAPPGGTNSWRAMGSVTAKSGCYSMTLFLRVA